MCKRCDWVSGKPQFYLDYHDHEWSVAEHDDRKLFELLILEGFQAGLSWECILKKRDAFRKAFDNFNPEIIANYPEEKVEVLMNDSGIVRNRRKILATIQNARSFLQIQKEYGSFDSYLWHFTSGEVIFEDYHIRTTSPLSDEISKDLKRRGMNFVGSTIIYSYLQACGIYNAHGDECDWHKQNL